MNWKTLLVIASLSLSAGLTACAGGEKAPEAGGEAKPPETTAPAASPDAMKSPEAGVPAASPEAGAKTDEKKPAGTASPAAGAKTDEKKPADTPKKP
jgi:hypothetical protein